MLVFEFHITGLLNNNTFTFVLLLHSYMKLHSKSSKVAKCTVANTFWLVICQGIELGYRDIHY